MRMELYLKLAEAQGKHQLNNNKRITPSLSGLIIKIIHNFDNNID